MKRRLMTWSGIGAVALFAAIGGAWLFLLPAVGDQQPARALDEALTGSAPDTECARPTLSPCSSNTRGQV